MKNGYYHSERKRWDTDVTHGEIQAEREREREIREQTGIGSQVSEQTVGFGRRPGSDAVSAGFFGSAAGEEDGGYVTGI